MTQAREVGVAHYGDYQFEIYRSGLHGVLPKLPVDFRELESRAHAAMPPWVVSYVAGGCGNEHTQNINVSAFERWGLILRMFVGAAKRDMSIDLFGMRLPTPLFLCPIGIIGLCAQDGPGDIATATAARKLGVPMIASILSNAPLEQVASEFGERRAFFSSMRPPIARLPRVWSTGQRRRASRGSW
jgi:lactate 2-monooxygenase